MACTRTDRLLEDADDLFCQRMDDAVVDFNTFTFSLDDPLVFQERKMLGDGSLRKTQALPDMLYVALLGAEAGHNLEPYGMAKHLQYFGFVIEITGFIEFFRFHVGPHSAKSEIIYIV